MTPTLTLGEKSVELPALEPSDALLYGKHAVELIHNLIQTGELPPTGEGARQWLKQDPGNKPLFDAAKQFLGSYAFDQIDEAFQEAYRKQLMSTPAGRASLLLAKANVQTGWRLEHLDPLLILALTH